MRRRTTGLAMAGLLLGLGGCPSLTSGEESTVAGDREPLRVQAASPAEEETGQAGGRGEEPTHGGARAKPDPARPEPEAGAGEAPARVSARHILVQYAGSARAGSNIERDKDQARERAKEVLDEARAPDADFAALAREYSDGPSGRDGGDLGAFGRGRMHPAFERAAFGLDVGEVSGLVETPFGFHVIKRYR